jgi:hypothetical protein
VAVENRSLLEDFLPTEPSVTELMPKLDVRDLSRLARTCRGLRDLFNAPLLIARAAHYIIVEPDNDNIKKVIAMLDADPWLVGAVINQVTSNTGLIIKKKTLFQLANGAGDAEFCHAMKAAFIKHCGSEEAAIKEMERQRNEILESEEEYKKKEVENTAHIQLLLQPVIAAIDAEQFYFGRDANEKILLSPATLAAIETFRDELRKWLLNMKSGMHFHYNTLLEAYNTHAVLVAQWQYDIYKCALFEDGVLSSILAYVPENDAQKFSQGLYYLQDDNEPCRRSVALREGGKNFYKVLRGPSKYFALSGSCVHILRGEVIGCSWIVREVARRIKTYVEQKYQPCIAYVASRTTNEVSACNLKK